MAGKEKMQSIERTFQLLEFMAANDSTGVRELHKELGLSTTSVHRMLTTLVELGYAQKNMETDKYVLTYKLAAIGNQIMRRNDAVKLVHPELLLLSEKCRETVHFVEREGTEVRYIDIVISNYGTYSMQSYIGLNLPLFCTAVGKAIMAELSQQEVTDIWNQRRDIRYTEKTIQDLDSLLKEIEEIKKYGYAFDNEEREVGLSCVGVSINGYDGMSRYGVSVSGPTNRITGERLHDICEALLESKKRISTLLGWS